MIKSLWLKNFGPYEGCQVNFGSFATILGANGAGKSFLFSALKAIGRISKWPLRSKSGFGGYPTRTGQVAFDDIVHKKDKSRTAVIGVEFESEGIAGVYEVQLRSWRNPGGTISAERLDITVDGKEFKVDADEGGNVTTSIRARDRFRTPRFVSIPGLLYVSRDEKEHDIGERIQNALVDRVGVYRFDPTALKSPADVGRPLSPTGYNFAAYLDRIQNDPGGKKVFESITKLFLEACPHVEEILLPADTSGDGAGPTKRLAFTMKGTGETIPASLESDGTVLLLAYAALLHGSLGHDTLCIEEPENGVHPKVIPQQVNMLRALTKPSGDRKAAQVLVCTHSARFLDEVRNDPSGIRLVRRGSDGRSTIEAPPASQMPSVPGWAGLT